MNKCHMQIDGLAARQRNHFKVREERLHNGMLAEEKRKCLWSQAKEMWNMINHDLWSAENWILSPFTLVPLLPVKCYAFGCLRLNDKRGIIWPSSRMNLFYLMFASFQMACQFNMCAYMVCVCVGYVCVWVVCFYIYLHMLPCVCECVCFIH